MSNTATSTQSTTTFDTESSGKAVATTEKPKISKVKVKTDPT